MSWSIGATGIGTVTVSKWDSISETTPVRTDTFDPDGSPSDIFGVGKGLTTLSLGGALFGSSNGTIESNYISVLRNLNGTIVTVASPDNQYDGSWLMTQFDYERLIDSEVFYTFSVKLVKGGTIIIL